MKLKKRVAFIVVLCLMCITAIALFTACDPVDSMGSSDIWTYERVYAEALDLGFEGTLEELIETLRGADGKDGENGIGIKSIVVNADGKLIITLSNGIEINCGSVKGDQGEKGEKGDDGKSAYDIWLENGHTGSEEDFLNWLKGKDGEDLTACSHTYSGWEVIVAATCTSIGYSTRECSACGDIEYQFSEATEHVWGTGRIILPVSCEDTGILLYTCEVCKLTKYEEISALGHDIQKHEAQEATCTEKGWNAYEDCSKCSYTTYSEIAALGHDIQNHEAKAATCIESGWNEYQTCSRCNYTTLQEIPSLGGGKHDYVEGVCTRCNQEEPSDGLLYAVSTDGTYASVINIGTCSDTKVVIDSLYNGLPVKEIGNSAFKGCSNIETVIFPEGLTSIGESAFESCTSLTNIVLPDSLVDIGAKAFYYTNSAANITLGTGLKFIDSKAFETTNNSSRTGKLTVRDISAFFRITFTDQFANPVYRAHRIYDTSGNEITVAAPTNITKINAYAAYNWSGLKEVVIPEGVTYIGPFAFGDGSSPSQSGLNKLTFPSTLQEVGTNAFYFCTKINKLIIKDAETLANIQFTHNSVNDHSDPRVPSPNLVVEYTNVITEVVIPDGTRTIAASMYMGTSTLKKIIIPYSVTSIGAGAFSGCNGIERIEYNGTLADWLNISFADGGSNPWKNNATLVVLSEEDRKTQIEYPKNSTVVIPSSVVSIGKYTFYEGNLETVVLHDRIETFGIQAFAGCPTLRKVIVPTIDAWFGYTFEGSITGLDPNDPNLARANTSNPLACNINVKFYVGDEKNHTLMNTITTPARVATLKQYVFSGARCFDKITISADVTSIGAASFTGCTAEVVFESGSKLKTIGADSFNNYAGTATITIPDSVTVIGAYAFYACKFSSIVLGQKVKLIQASAFHNCTNLSSISLPDGVTEIGVSAFRNCTSLNELFIPKSVMIVGRQAFIYCSNLTLMIEYESEFALPVGWTTSTPAWNAGIENRILYGQTR